MAENETKEVKNYTDTANQFIDNLLESGYDRADIFTKFVNYPPPKGGELLVLPSTPSLA